MKRTNRAYDLFRASALVALAAMTVVAVLAPPPVCAGEGDGGTQSVFSIGAGSRALGLGRSFVSIAADASSVYWNPATLRNVQQAQLMFMYMPVFGDFTGADYVYFGAVYPTLNAGAFGAGFQRIGAKFDAYDEFSSSLGEKSYSESQLLISYAFERHSKWVLGTLATGASFKIVSQNIDPYSSTAPGVDVGFRWIPDAARSFAIGVNLQDISGAEQKLDVATDVTYRTIMAGAGYTHHFDNGSALRLLFQVDLPEKADNRYHTGAEYQFSKYMTLRAGYDEGNISFGFGVNVSAFDVDYAYLSREEAGQSHPLTFSVGVGPTQDDKRREIADAEAAELQALLEQQYATRVAASRTRALHFESEANFASALDEWKLVLEFMPGDPEATEGEARARQQLLTAQAAATRNAENHAVIQTRFEQGLAFYEDNNFARAMGEWQTILDIDSTHAGALDYRDRTQAKIDEAVSAHIQRANELERNARYTEAIGEWNNVQVYDPDNTEARTAIQRLRNRIESVSKDNEAAQRRLRIVTLYNDALRMYNQGEYQQALGNLDEVLRLQPDHEEAKRLRTQAIRKTTPLTDQEKERIRSLYLAGMQHFAKDEYAKAIEEWQKILEIDPTNESVQRNIEEARQRLRQLENR
jgi:tetratricopeptide (TPR) repeat protein